MSRRITSIIIALVMVMSAAGITVSSAGVEFAYADAGTGNEESYEYLMTVDPIPDQEFDEKGVCPVPAVRVNGIPLEQAQYEITGYTDNMEPGFGMVTVRLVFNDSLYELLGIDSTANINDIISKFNTVSESVEFKILQPKVEKPKSFEIYGLKKTYQYEGAPVEPKITVKDGDTVLTEGIHYVVEYDELTELNMSLRVTATGIGEYKGFTAQKWYNVVFKYGRHMQSSRVLGTYTYTGKPITPKVEVLGNFMYSDGIFLTDPQPLKAGVDYIVVAKNNVNAGSKAQYNIKGLGYWMGMEPMPKYFTIAKRNVKNLKVTGITDKVYTSKAIKQKNINMYLGDKKMVKGKEYKVTYKNNVKCGKATVVIKGIGRNFTGTKTITFNIYPRKVKNVKLISGDNAITVKYNKNYGGVTGYQARYSESKDFKSFKSRNSEKTSIKIPKLGNKKKYYVKVRAYKVVNGKKVFGKWSDVKSVKTK